MGSRVEILNDGGFRSDGRRQYELRDMTIDLSQQGVADGSAIITHGLTQVLVSVFGPARQKCGSHTMHDRANINVEVGVAAFSTGERRKRSRGDKRILEMAATIKSTFEPVVQTSLYPRSQIDIFVQVLQQDGGLLQALHSTSPMLDLTLLEENDIPHVTVAVMPKTGKVTLILRLAGEAGKVIHAEIKELCGAH
ncbi:exosome component 4 [Mycena olivaceomarginata]|nr:exosome component 4 [Mycena olivaceomarginata]